MTELKFKRDSFIRNLARGDILVPHLERYDDWDRPFTFEYQPKEHDEGWHPSGDCLPSVQHLYDKAKGSEREKISPSLQRTFLVGHFWHQVIQDALVELELATPNAIERKGSKIWGVDEGWGPTVSAKLPRPKPYHYAAGSGDVAPLIVGEWQGIMDIKTANDRSFKHVVKHGDFDGQFSQKYEAQLNCYMDFFDQPAGMILLVNKNDSKFAEIRYDRNDDLIAEVYAKWHYVSDLLDAGLEWDDEMEMDFNLPFKGPVK